MKWFVLITAFISGALSILGLVFWTERKAKVFAAVCWLVSIAWLVVAILKAVAL